MHFLSPIKPQRPFSRRKPLGYLPILTFHPPSLSLSCCRTESASLGADRYKVQTRVAKVQTQVPKVQTRVPKVQTWVELLKMLEVDMQCFL